MCLILQEHFQQGNIIRLVCHSTKQALRILNGRVDGQGGLGEYGEPTDMIVWTDSLRG